MRGKILGAALVLLIAAGIVAAVTPAQAPGTETIVVQEGFGKSKLIQSGHRRFVPGDVLLEQLALLDSARETRVGTLRHLCTVHFGALDGSRNMLCTEQITIWGRGTIQADGVIHLGTASDRLVVVGGTSDFEDVGGTIGRALTPGLAVSTITIDLIYH